MKIIKGDPCTNIVFKIFCQGKTRNVGRKRKSGKREKEEEEEVEAVVAAAAAAVEATGRKARRNELRRR